MSGNISEILDTLAEGRDLSEEQAGHAFGRLMHGELTPGQAGAFLMGLRAKGETPQELAAGVRECLAKARRIEGLAGPRVDTCGTGGDGQCSFNCSTTVALMLAALGHNVVKHGNRSVSSKCGSADVLEAMGMPLAVEPGDVPARLAESGFVFLFAPGFHPAFKHVMPLRKELGIRTLFNLMGPLLNPARPTHQILGVGDAGQLELVAETLALSGVERAAVVHGAGGFDELTPFGINQVLYVEDGAVREAGLNPADLGLADDREDAVRVDGPEQSLAAVRALLRGEGDPTQAAMVALNLAMALYLLEGIPFAQAADKAKTAVASGEAGCRMGLI